MTLLDIQVTPAPSHSRPEVLVAELADLASGNPVFNGGPLAVLREYDGDRGTDFLGSLLSYFEAGGDFTEAAKRLYVHRNTLRYRLQRVEALSGVRLGDPLERFALELQVRLHFVSPAKRIARGTTIEG
jgi:hypothetical protein